MVTFRFIPNYYSALTSQSERAADDSHLETGISKE